LEEPEREKEALEEKQVLAEAARESVALGLADTEAEGRGDVLLDCWMLALAAGD